MILIDAHVHIYDCFDLEKFFDSAYTNFESAAEKLGHGDDFNGILLLAETTNESWFKRLSDFTNGKNLPDGYDTGSWIFRSTNENNSLLAESGGSRKLILIAGSQIITAEGIEVLALCISNRFDDGKPISDLIREIKEKNGIPVVPWGFGKWFGNRGKIVKHLIDNNTSLFYLGDNRNRGNFWPKPTLFKLAKERGIGVLPGSDPLPFVSESGCAGSYGFITQSQLDPRKATSVIKQILLDEANNSFRVFGKLEKSHKFLLNQIRAQINRRFPGASTN